MALVRCSQRIPCATSGSANSRSEVHRQESYLIDIRKMADMNSLPDHGWNDTTMESMCFLTQEHG